MSEQAVLSGLHSALAYRFNLRADQSSFEEIDRNIRDGIEIRGTNLWVLMLAIFIASIGLNVNSTAVIIGAMLISPLMGPIMGVGYGVGINDNLLIKKALGNLLISLLIALFTSTFYFWISPLSVAQSELLARTTPNIWAVLIALFGGLAEMLVQRAGFFQKIGRQRDVGLLRGAFVARGANHRRLVIRRHGHVRQRRFSFPLGASFLTGVAFGDGAARFHLVDRAASRAGR